MRLLRTLVIVLAVLALSAELGVAQEKSATLRLPVRADSKPWLEGSSNVRDWTCKATAMEALIAVDAQTVDSRDDLTVAKSLRGVDVIVPVRMLKCGDRHMEANLYDALKAPKPPATSYIIADFELTPSLVGNDSRQSPRPVRDLREPAGAGFRAKRSGNAGQSAGSSTRVGTER